LCETFVTIGKIVKPIGLHGEVKIFPLTDFPERFEGLQDVMVQTKEGQHRRYCIAQMRYGPPFVSSRDAVQFLRGGLLQVSEHDRVSLPDGGYFQSDLIGLDVYSVEGSYLGIITDVIETGSNDVFVVRDREREYLIPALQNIIKTIDLKEKRMVIDPPEGLFNQ